MTDTISHRGVVVAVETDVVRVRIMQQSACSLCKVSKHCHASESKEKEIVVMTDDSNHYRVGDDVTVKAEQKMGWIALFYAMLLPLIVMISVLLFSTITGLSQGLSAMLSLLSLIPYYYILFLSRNHLSRKISFTIEKNN